MKEAIREFVLNAGADAAGFAAADDYRSPNSPPIRSVFPEVKSIIVMGLRELSSCDSPSPQVAMNGRLDLMEFSHFRCLAACPAGRGTSL
jgi:hypothetical protein